MASNTFLSLDQLRQERNRKLSDDIESATRTFGQAPLTVANFLQTAQDRARKIALEDEDSKRKDEDQAMQRTSFNNAQEDRGMKNAADALGKYVAGRLAEPGKTETYQPPTPAPQHVLAEGQEGPVVPAPVTPPPVTRVTKPSDSDIIAGARDNPNLGMVRGDEEVRAELQKQRDDREYKNALLGVKQGTVEAKRQAIDVQTRLADLRAKGMLSEDQYRKGMLALGWTRENNDKSQFDASFGERQREFDQTYDQRDRQFTERAGERANALKMTQERLDLSRQRFALAEADKTKLPEPVRKQFQQIDQSIQQLNALRDFKSENDIKLGLGPDLWSKWQNLTATQSGDRATFEALADKFAADMNLHYNGTAQTQNELARTIKLYPRALQSEEGFQAVLDAAVSSLEREDSSLINSLNLTSGGQRMTVGIGQRSGPRGERKPVVPETPGLPPPPDVVGRKVPLIGPNGEKLLVPENEVPSALAQGAKRVN